ncbi:MAG TPA: DUF2933 domain-containing protein [Gammaproteobacteria bacterium]
MNEPKSRFWTTPSGWAAILLMGGAGYLLLSEHQAHVIAALPWLILLACPLLHVFMHRGHGHGGGDGKRHDHEHKDSG